MSERRLHIGQQVVILAEIETNHGVQTGVKGVIEGILPGHYQVRPQYYRHFVKLTNDQVKPT